MLSPLKSKHQKFSSTTQSIDALKYASIDMAG
jgi:hypothetical protein